MKLSKTVQISLWIVVGIGSIGITAKLLAQQSGTPKGRGKTLQGPSPTARVAPPVSGSVLGTIRKMTPEEVAERHRQAADPEFQFEEMKKLETLLQADKSLGSSFGSKAMTVRAQGNRMSVSSQFLMYDANPHQRYRWTLRVYDDLGKTKFIDRSYDHQVFTIPAKKLMDPTFTETVALQPGDYSVEVILHGVPEGVDFADFQDHEVEQRHIVANNIKKITVTR